MYNFAMLPDYRYKLYNYLYCLINYIEMYIVIISQILKLWSAK